MINARRPYQFAEDDEVKEAIDDCFRSQPGRRFQTPRSVRWLPDKLYREEVKSCISKVFSKYIRKDAVNAIQKPNVQFGYSIFVLYSSSSQIS